MFPTLTSFLQKGKLKAFDIKIAFKYLNTVIEKVELATLKLHHFLSFFLPNLEYDIIERLEFWKRFVSLLYFLFRNPIF